MARRARTTLRPDWLRDPMGNMITTTYAKIPNYDIMGSDLDVTGFECALNECAQHCTDTTGCVAAVYHRPSTKCWAKNNTTLIVEKLDPPDTILFVQGDVCNTKPYANTVAIVAMVATGLLALALVVVCVLCVSRHKLNGLRNRLTTPLLTDLAAEPEPEPEPES